MKRFSEQLNTRAKSVKLRAAEKRELRERVVSYMEYHPLPAEMKVTKQSPKIAPARQMSEPFTTFQIPFVSLFKYSAFAAILLVVVVPFVAEKAVPGDALYAVKVQFNEELRSTLTFDTYQKVEWETERLNRRIAEARLLASEGRLTDEAEADVAEAVRVHSANAQREIAELRTQDEDAATIASISLDTTLELQSDSLRGEDDVVAKANETELTSTFERPVNLIASAIDESRTNQEEAKGTSTIPAYGKLMAKVEQNTTRIYELLAALDVVAPAEDLVDVTRRAEDINRAIQEVIDLYPTDEAEARQRLVTVLQRTQRLIVYMTELEVIKTIDIETLIPVVLTDGEVKARKAVLTEELTKKLKEIEVQLVLATDQDVIEKVNFARDEINANLLEITSTSTPASALSLEAFEAIAHNGISLADDSLKLMEQFLGKTIEREIPLVDKETASSTEEVETIDEDEEVVTEENIAEGGSDAEVENEEDEVAPEDAVDSL